MIDKNKIKKLSQENLDSLLIEMSKQNDLETIVYITTSKELKKHADIFQSNCEAFGWAAYYGYRQVIEFFLTSPLLDRHIDIHLNNDYAFNVACENNHLELIKYYLTSPKLKEHAKPYSDNHYGFRYACSRDHKEVIQYLCNIPEIYTPDLLAGKQQGFNDACQNGRLDLLTFLLSCPKEYGIIEVNAYDNAGWKEAVANNHINILHYLYQFPEVKKSIMENFNNSGLMSFRHYNNANLEQKNDIITTFNYLCSLKEIQNHFKPNNLENLLYSSIKNYNDLLSEYIIKDNHYMPSDDFIKQHKGFISPSLKTFIKKVQLNIKLEEQLDEKTSIKTLKI